MLEKAFEKVPESIVYDVNNYCEMQRRKMLFSYLGDEEQVKFYEKVIKRYERDLNDLLKK